MNIVWQGLMWMCISHEFSLTMLWKLFLMVLLGARASAKMSNLGSHMGPGVEENTYLIQAKWQRYASVTKAVVGSDNGFLLEWCPAINWANPSMLSIGPSETNPVKIEISCNIFHWRKSNWKHHLQNASHMVWMWSEKIDTKALRNSIHQHLWNGPQHLS